MTEASGPNPSNKHQGRPPRRYWQASVSPHWIEVCLAIALIIVGGAQVTIYLRQASIMETQVSIAAAQNTLTIENSRAFIVLKDISYVHGEPSAEADGRDFILILKNVGKHVAIVTAINTEPFYGVVHKELPDTPHFYNSISLVAPPVAPDSEVTIRAHMGGARTITPQPVPLIETVLKGVNDGTIPIWIYGRVQYNTGFPGILGELGFCSKFVPPSQRSAVSPFIFITCEYPKYTYVH
jgi:hypothetical protein